MREKKPQPSRSADGGGERQNKKTLNDHKLKNQNKDLRCVTTRSLTGQICGQTEVLPSAHHAVPRKSSLLSFVGAVVRVHTVRMTAESLVSCS